MCNKPLKTRSVINGKRGKLKHVRVGSAKNFEAIGKGGKTCNRLQARENMHHNGKREKYVSEWQARKLNVKQLARAGKHVTGTNRGN